MIARILCGSAVLACLFFASAEAQIWDGGGAAGGAVTWTTPANWSPDGVPANNGTANITMAGVIDNTNTLDVNYDINSLTFSNTAGAFIINNSGGATLTIRGGGITNNDVDIQQINAPVILAAGQTWTTLSGGQLAIGGTVNLGTFQLVINNSPTTYITGVIQNTTGSIVKNGTGNLYLSSNNLFSGGLTLNSGTILFGNNGAAGTGTLTINGGTLQADGAPRTLGNTLTLGGDFTVSGAFDLSFSGAATLTGNRNITTSSGTTTFSGAIGENAAGLKLFKGGTGTLTFSGASPNTYTGTTNVYAGTLLLNKTAGVNAVGGNIQIGDGSGGAGADVVRLLASDQIPDLATVYIEDSGRLDLNNSSETIYRLEFIGEGSVTTGTGTLTLGDGGLFCTGIFSSPATISGLLNLGGATRTFTVHDGVTTIDLDISAPIASGGITKESFGTLQFSGANANTYTGTTTVNAGTLLLSKTVGVNAIAGNLVAGDGVGGTNSDIARLGESNQILNSVDVIVNASGLFDLNGFSDTINDLFLASGNVTTGAGTLTITGLVSSNSLTTTSTMTGLLNLNGGNRIFNIDDGVPATDVDISAVISNGGITKSGAGTLKFSGANNNLYTGTTTVNAGTLVLANTVLNGAILGDLVIGDGSGTDTVQLGDNDQIGSSPVTISSSGVLDLAGFFDAVESLSVTGGSVIMGTGALIAENVNLSGGTISSTGPGTLVLNGPLTTNAATAAATISGGLNLNGGLRNFTVADGSATVDLNVTGTITVGTLDKNGAGTMQLTGTADSTTWIKVNDGTLLLANPSGNAIQGILDVGNGTSGPLTDVVRLMANDQLADNATDIAVQSDGLLELNGFSDTVGVLFMSGGSITTGAGTLTLSNSVSTFAHPQTASIAGNLNLGTAPRTFTVNDGPPAIDLTISATITAGAGGQLIKEGAGTMQLSATQNVPITLNAGALAGAFTVGPNGSFTQNGGTVTGMLETFGPFTYNGGTFSGRLINHYTATFNADFTAGNGMQNLFAFNVPTGRTFTFNGAGLDSQGVITFTGGTIGGSGPLVNSGLISGHGTIAGSGGFQNLGQLDLTTGNVTISNSGANTNAGAISVASALQLRLTGGTLTNTGTNTLSGGNIGGTATLVNAAGGTVEGGSCVQVPTTHDGGLIHANAGTTLLITNLSGGNINGGELRIENASGINVVTAFASSGTIVLLGADAQLSGGTVTNTGIVRGRGRVTNSVLNSGTVLAEGGRLTLSGSGHTNTAVGIIEANTAAEVFYSQGLATNAGQIALVGGTFDNNNRTLANTGSVAGEGVIRTGGLTNTGSIGVGGGDLDLIGPVTNNSTVSIQSASTARFFGPVNGPGNYAGTGTAMFLNSFSPGASPAQVNFGGNLVFGGAASLNIELAGTAPGTQFDRLVVGGSASLAGSLNVVLLDSFAPAAGNSFQIISAAGGVIGMFASHSLPALGANLEWDVLYGSNNVTLQVNPTGLIGDYNQNGVVDAADYIVWRGNEGTTNTLPNDPIGGTIGIAQFSQWRANFGQSGAASGASAAVPEPRAILLLLGGLLVLLPRAWRQN